MLELPYGDSKNDNYLQKEWFTALVAVIKKWYENRHGVTALIPDIRLKDFIERFRFKVFFVN